MCIIEIIIMFIYKHRIEKIIFLLLKSKSTEKKYSKNIWNTFCKVFQILRNIIITKYSNTYSEYFFLKYSEYVFEILLKSILPKSDDRITGSNLCISIKFNFTPWHIF